MFTSRSPSLVGRVARAGGIAALCMLESSCVPHRPVVVAPIANPVRAASALEDDTRITHPTRIIFGWKLNDSGVHMHGRGVARLEGPYRARLDLFLSNGEAVVSAALVGQDLRIPAGARRDILPPAELMWGVLGVIRPETSTELLGADQLEGGGVQLRYRYPDGRQLRYQVDHGRVVGLQVLQDGHTIQAVRLKVSPQSRYPAKATYRDLTAFRELELTRESVEEVESYPPDIWDPVR